MSKTAVVVLALDEYIIGAKTLFNSLRRLGNLPDKITPIVLGQTYCKFAEAVPITDDFSWIPTASIFSKTHNKYFGLTLPFDRIIMLDADTLCVGDCSSLWTDTFTYASMYAAPDTAAQHYYPSRIPELGLDASALFNSGVMIYNQLPTDLLDMIRTEKIISYDGGDQGYLNAYYQLAKPRQHVQLSSEYNQCVCDAHMPKTEIKRIVHFTGAPEMKPWRTNFGGSQQCWYDCWLDMWKTA